MTEELNLNVGDVRKMIDGLADSDPLWLDWEIEPGEYDPAVRLHRLVRHVDGDTRALVLKVSLISLEDLAAEEDANEEETKPGG